ncbi:MAG: PP2C family protein-serine/threonine phosphatase [Gammaproteobacteria bacterium]
MADPIYKILVVDDEPDLEPLVLMRMRREIRSGLYTFVFAHNGVEALEMIKKEGNVDMVLSDINMPQMDGLTLLDQISDAEPDLRSVIISAYGDMKNIRTAMNRGAFDFIIKPIDFDDFRITISRGLSQLAKWREALSSRDKLVSLQHELDVAHTIQQSILPTRFPDTDNFQIKGGMEPAHEVGGDFFYVEQFSDGRVGLAIADVSDKGVPAALFMMLTRTLLKGALRDEKATPGQALEAVNELLKEDNDASMFVTLFYAIYDPNTGSFTYANGGHNPPLHVHKDGSSELLAMTGGIALGVVAEHKYAEQSLQLSAGDNIVLYTDGVTEAINTGGEEFGIEQLREVFSKSPGMDSNKINETMLGAVKTFIGDAPPFDDITCLTLHQKK